MLTCLNEGDMSTTCWAHEHRGGQGVVSTEPHSRAPLKSSCGHARRLAITWLHWLLQHVRALYSIYVCCPASAVTRLWPQSAQATRILLNMHSLWAHHAHRRYFEHFQAVYMAEWSQRGAVLMVLRVWRCNALMGSGLELGLGLGLGAKPKCHLSTVSCVLPGCGCLHTRHTSGVRARPACSRA